MPLPNTQDPRYTNSFTSRFLNEQNERMVQEVFNMQDELLRMSLPEAQAHIREQLARHGTRVEVNDNDPYGDGDQTPVASNKAQFYRDLFASGGDINHHTQTGLQANLTDFCRFCLLGDVANVRKALKEASTEYREGPPPPALTALLEQRFTSQRLSPLLLLVAMGKNLRGMPGMAERQVAVAKVLLEYGARPDARDVAGKTVCHYGMGQCATMDMTVLVACACSDAHKSSDLYGQQVELHGLVKGADLNGQVGWCRGYMVESGRRQVYLPEQDRVVSLKRKNLRKVIVDDNGKISGKGETVEEESNEKREWLCDVPDRLGSVALHELVPAGRTDVVQLMFDMYVARLDVADCDGETPLGMSLKAGATLISPVAALITKEAGYRAKKAASSDKNKCTNCGKKAERSALQMCGICKSTWYCNRRCQTEHWKLGGHKDECKLLAAKRQESIQLDRPRSSNQYGASVNFASGSVSASTGGYRKPRHVAVDEVFDIKVQGGGIRNPSMPLMIYDKSRECNFSLHPGELGFDELNKAVSEEPTWGGRKTFVLASFDANGNCKVFPGCTSVKKW